MWPEQGVLMLLAPSSPPQEGFVVYWGTDIPVADWLVLGGNTEAGHMIPKGLLETDGDA